MPAGLNFLSVYAALSLAYHTHNSPGALVLAAATVCLGIFKVGWLSDSQGLLAGIGLAALRTVRVVWHVQAANWARKHACADGTCQQARFGTWCGGRNTCCCYGHARFGRLALTIPAHVRMVLLQTWLRVFLGFHTWPQVLVGAALGASTAATWFKLGTGWALPALQQSSTGLGVLYAVTGLGSAAFGYKIITGWWKEQQQKRQQSSGRLRHAGGDEDAQLLLQQQQADASNGVSGSQGGPQSVAPPVPAPSFAS